MGKLRHRKGDNSGQFASYSPDSTRTLGQNFKTARQRRNLTADEAAEACGVSRATWYAYEGDRQRPTLDGLLAIAVKLSTTAERLLRGVK